MSSHDIRVSVEHYVDGGYGVIGSNFSAMGLSNLDEVFKAVEEVIFKEAGLLYLAD